MTDPIITDNIITDTIITDLQGRLAFQEDLLATLDTRIAEQQSEIEVLTKQLQHLNKKLKTMEENLVADDGGQAPPPHY